MKYLLQTKITHLCYGRKGSDLVLGAYCDASFRPTLKTNTNQRCSYGWVFTLGSCPISWCAKRFNVASLNVCKGDMVAIKETSTWVIHLRALFLKLGETQPEPTIMHIGTNDAYPNLISKYFYKRLKHVNIACQWVCEQLSSGVIDVNFFGNAQITC